MVFLIELNSKKLVKEKKNIWHPSSSTLRFSQYVLVSKLGEDIKNIYIYIYIQPLNVFSTYPFSNPLAFVAALSALCHVSSYLVLLFLTDLLKFLFSIFTPSVTLDYWREHYVTSTNSSFSLYARCLATELFLFTFQSDSV